MKILVIQHTDMIGGSLNGAIELVRSLYELNRNDQIDFYVQSTYKGREEIYQNYGIRVLDNDLKVTTFDYFNGGNGLARTLLKYCMTYKYKKEWKLFLNREKYDLVILNTSVLWPLCNAINKSGAKCICYIRETVKGSVNSFINRQIRNKLSKCTKLFFLTEFDRRKWDVHLSKEKQFVLPECVNLPNTLYNKKSEREKLSLDNDTFYVLFMGGMQKIKGAEIIVKAMKIIKDKGYSGKVCLLILGESGTEILNFVYKFKYFSKVLYQKKVNDYIKKHTLNDVIIKCGYQRNIYEWLAASDVVVFPVTSVHQARPIYEAGAVERSIILPDFPNYEDNLINGFNGVTFEKGNAESLSNRIIEMYNNKAFLEQLGKNNYQMTKIKHSRNNITEILKKTVYSV